MQDIMHLNQTDMPIPASIYIKVFTGIVIVDDSNRFNFVRFDEEHEIKFFRELEFVIDYDQYKDLNDDQLEEECQKLAKRSNEIAEIWNTMTQEERKKNSNLLQEHENLGYMLNFLSEIYAMKGVKNEQEKRISIQNLSVSKDELEVLIYKKCANLYFLQRKTII